MKTINYGPPDRYKQHRIELLCFNLEVVLCHNIEQAANQPRRQAIIKERVKGPFLGLWAYNEWDGFIFIAREAIRHKIIAHEVLHATHFMMQQNAIQFGPEKCHETAALVCECITNLVYTDLKAWKAKVTL